MADTTFSTQPIGAGDSVKNIDSNDFSVTTSYDNTVDMRGVIDYGNIAQFAQFETGYCFLSVINGPGFANMVNDTPKGKGFLNLQKAFISILEKEFKGLDGIDDITSDTMEITDNITSMSLIAKVNQSTNSQISMRFYEKEGALITTYISKYLRMIKDSKTEAKTYGGAITANTAKSEYGPKKEIFNMMYIVTDATCLHVEKAFLILNAQPTSAAFSEIYTADKGEIGNKEVNVTFNAFVVDGSLVNKAASNYLEAMVQTSANTSGKINVNSWDFNWSITTGDGTVKTIDQLQVGENGVIGSIPPPKK